MEWPLSGLRVADLSAGIAGGYCTKVLADGGAEVIKLEPPEGDRLRAGPAGTPRCWFAVHRPGSPSLPAHARHDCRELGPGTAFPRQRRPASTDSSAGGFT